MVGFPALTWSVLHQWNDPALRVTVAMVGPLPVWVRVMKLAPGSSQRVVTSSGMVMPSRMSSRVQVTAESVVGLVQPIAATASSGMVRIVIGFMGWTVARF